MPIARAPVVLLLVTLLVGVASAAPACAKYRLQWMYQLNDGVTPEAMRAANAKFLAECKGLVVADDDGPAVATKSGAYGIVSPAAGVEFADYGGFMDFASLADLKACFAKGVKSGSLAALRKNAKKSSRVTYALPTCTAPATAPATIRYMFNYKLSDFSDATCTTAVGLQAKITGGLGAMRHANGCDALGSTAAYGPNIPVSANYGGFVDFKSAADMTAYLSSTKPAVKAARAEIRKMPTSVMRIAIPFSSGAKVAKERAAVPL